LYFKASIPTTSPFLVSPNLASGSVSFLVKFSFTDFTPPLSFISLLSHFVYLRFPIHWHVIKVFIPVTEQQLGATFVCFGFQSGLPQLSQIISEVVV